MSEVLEDPGTSEADRALLRNRRISLLFNAGMHFERILDEMFGPLPQPESSATIEER